MPRLKEHPRVFEISVKEHVRDRICVERDWDVSQTRLEVPLEGRRSLVRIVVGPTGERVVLRLYISPEEIQQARKTVWAQRRMEESGVPTPRHLRVMEDFALRGVVLIEEEFIAGDSLSRVERTDETMHALAETFGRLHAIRAPHHGDPLDPRRRGYGSRVTGRFLHLLRRMRQRLPSGSRPRECRELRRWARAWKPALDSLSYHSLIFGRPNSANIRFTPDGDVHLLDLGTMSWGSPARDLAQLRIQSFEGDSSRWQMFREHHRRVVGPEIDAEIERLLPLFETLYHLSEAAKLAKRHHQGTGGPALRTGARPLNRWESTLATARRFNPPETGMPTSAADRASHMA